VTTGGTGFGQQGLIAQELIDRASTLWVEAAERSDAEGLGVDDRVKLVHSLCDLGVQSYVAMIRALIAGPALATGAGQASTPQPSELITVDRQSYARALTPKDFVRVGIPGITVPPSAIGFQPDFLPAGITQFQIVLKDYRFVGANYTGKVVLTNMADPAATPDEKVVTVGL
jgi:hypothetical protein